MILKVSQLKEWFFLIEEPPNTSAKNVASRAFKIFLNNIKFYAKYVHKIKGSFL
jgi:hypothetical protein